MNFYYEISGWKLFNKICYGIEIINLIIKIIIIRKLDLNLIVIVFDRNGDVWGSEEIYDIIYVLV